jgi:hypothetical protein
MANLKVCTNDLVAAYCLEFLLFWAKNKKKSLLAGGGENKEQRSMWRWRSGGGWISSQCSPVVFIFFPVRWRCQAVKRLLRVTRPPRSDALRMCWFVSDQRASSHRIPSVVSHQRSVTPAGRSLVVRAAAGGFVKSWPSFTATCDRTAQPLVLIGSSLACLKRGTCVAEAATS